MHASRHREVGCHRGKLRLRDNRRSGDIGAITYCCPPSAAAGCPAARTSRLPTRTFSVPSKTGQLLVSKLGEYFLKTWVCVSSDGPMMTWVRTGLPLT